MLAEYYVLVRPQVQELAFPTNKHSRFCRKVLGELVRAGLVGRSRKCVTYNENQTGCPVYFLTDRGRERLVESTQDESYLLASVSRPRDDRLEHWISISLIHMRLNAAVKEQASPYVAMPTFVTEWNQWRPDADSTPEHFLHVQFPSESEKPMSCSPDAAAIISVEGRHMALYFEACRGTSSVGQVVGRKHTGYQWLANTGLFRTRHFPGFEIDDFRVLVVTTNPWRRNQMARLMKDHMGWERWRFCTWDDFLPKTILHEEMMIDCSRNPTWLVKPPSDYQAIGVDLKLKKQANERLASANS